MQLRLTFLIVAAAILNSRATDTLADMLVINSASVNGRGNPTPAGETAFASLPHTVDDKGEVFEGDAFAGSGYIAGYAVAAVEGVPGFHTQAQVTSIASTQIFDTTVVGPPGVESIPTAVNFNIHGSLSAVATPNVSASASIRVTFIFNSVLQVGTLTKASGLATSSGFFVGNQDQNSFNVSIPYTVTLGAPNFTLMTVQAVAFADQNGANQDEAALAVLEYYHTISFATDRPVFDLPEGYTANSVSGNIVNNHWVPPVPEPSSCILTAFGLAAFTAWGWRRRRLNRARA